MKKLLTIVAVLFLYATDHAYAQNEKEMEAWTAYMTPGEVHKMMASWDGTWEGDVTMWMAPGQPPTKSKSTSVNKMILGGRYQEGRFTGNFNGMPMEGISTLAYDNAKKMFITTWIDNFGTGMMHMTGTWNPATKIMEFKGMSVDPMIGKEIPVREVFKIVDNDTQVMEMYMTPEGGTEFKSMEITFKRKK